MNPFDQSIRVPYSNQGLKTENKKIPRTIKDPEDSTSLILKMKRAILIIWYHADVIMAKPFE